MHHFHCSYKQLGNANHWQTKEWHLRCNSTSLLCFLCFLLSSQGFSRMYIYAISMITLHPFTTISMVGLDTSHAPIHIHNNDITKALRYGTTKSGLLFTGYMLEQISSHSLHASSAMALKLNGTNDTTIQNWVTGLCAPFLCISTPKLLCM